MLDARAAAELEQLDARLRMTKSTSKRAKLQRHREKLVEEAYGSGGSVAAEEEEEVAVEAAALPSYSAPLTDEEALALDEGMHALRTAGLSEPSKGNGRRNKQSLSGSKREKTWEREVLAERLRGELQLLIAKEEEEEGGGDAGDGGGDVEMELEEAATAGESYTMMHEEEIYMPGSGWVSPVDMAMESDKSPAEVNKHASEQASTRPQASTHSLTTYP